MLRISLSRLVIFFILVPLTTVFTASFFLVEQAVRNNTTAQIRAQLIEQQKLKQLERASQARQIQATLQVLSENAGLKAALTLHRDLVDAGALKDPANQRELTLTLEERLQAIRESIEVDSLKLVDARDNLLVQWQRSPVAVFAENAVPINVGGENLGRLVVGHRFDLSTIATGAHAVMLHNGKVIQSTLAAVKANTASTSYTTASELQLAGENFITMPVVIRELDPAYSVAVLASVDAAIAPFLSSFRSVLIPASAVSLSLALIVVWIASRAVTKPLQTLTDACRQSIQRGILEIPPTPPSGVLEVNVLADSLHRAAVAASSARLSLEQAYLQILEALVESLEARDPYTAGHSRRVSHYSLCIGRQMGFSESELECLRIGALLHDIGKIGIPDCVLLKDSRLTEEEFSTIKKHPDIGVRILERIGAFGPYLAAVGLHHENHDGTGYPNGFKGQQIPVDARIVHVADAYDAMTSNRPYRNRMPEDKVRRILRECANTQFDPAVIDAFFASSVNSMATSLESLNVAIESLTPRVSMDDNLPVPAEGPGVANRA